MTRLSRSLVFAATLAAATVVQAQQKTDHWVATWGTAQTLWRAPVAAPPVQPATPPPAPAPTPPPSPGVPARRFGIPPALPGLENQTIRMIARSSIGGTRVRVRLTNAFGSFALKVGAARLALRDKGSAIVPASDRTLTFGGRGAL